MKKTIIGTLLISSFFLLFFQGLAQKTNFTIDDLFNSSDYYSRSVYGLNSMKDGIHYSTIANDSTIAKYSYKTGKKVADIVSIKEINSTAIKRFTNYKFNADESKIIFYTRRKNIYRRSFTASYFVWDLKNKTLYQVAEKANQRLATLSPDGEKVAFVRDNNIFIVHLSSAKETQVTTDGEFNNIINGAPDWVYEEEFGYNQAFGWSPNGEYLAYCKWNESKVPIFNMTLYKGLYPELLKNKLHPENYAFKYPKAGEKNSTVSVHSYHVKTGKTLEIEVGKEQDQYIPRLTWSPKNKIVFYRLNRLQNKLEFLSANPETGSTQLFYTEKNKKYLEADYFDYLTFIENGEKFIYASERNGFLHLYLHNKDGKIIKQITQGNYDVTAYYGYDEKNKKIYYQSAEQSPINRDIYSIKIDGKGKRKLSQFVGTNDAVFSKTFDYYINYFSDANTPNLVSLNNLEGKQIRILENNKTLKKNLEQKNFSTKEFFSFKTSEGVKLNGWIMKPLNFDPKKKYPVLMTQYSGPNSQQVLNNFKIDWTQILATEGYFVVCVDGRGTGARGEAFRKLTYLQLGKYETIDQIETAKYLGGLNYIDAERIGIWGWSFGGFIALNCMTQGADYFKAGIAVAPVSNWRYYDNIYTERFMRTPQENSKGYDDNSPINHVEKLKGNLLLIHGTADDNVHLQNSVEIAEAFVQADKQFEMFYYTNRNHGIYGKNTRKHLFLKKINFLKRNL